jgi:putative oxidoreductase
VVELGAGGLLAAGFATPLATAGIVGVMVNAILTAHAGNGPWYFNGGWEYNVTLLAVATGLAFTGPGAAAIDPAANLELAGAGWGVAALGLGLTTGTIVLVRRQQPTAEAAAVSGQTDLPTSTTRVH